MRLTGMYSMNKDKTTMNLLGMTMNQFNNPLSLNSSLMANSGVNMTYFNNNNDDKEEKYIGKIVNGFRHGKGTLYYKNGSLKYEGDFAYDNFEGNGKCVYENGCYYIGEFKKGVKNGKGTLFYQNGRIWYEGDFVDDYYHGNGKLFDENGEYYIGQFYKNFFKGKGILY